ncbi:MAG: hypothetical protein R3B48_03180 [Kofleriaceae bacterium]
MSLAVAEDDRPGDDKAPAAGSSRGAKRADAKRGDAKRGETKRGDATLGRIANLADGWSVGEDEDADAPPPRSAAAPGRAAAIRAGTRRLPPPPRSTSPAARRASPDTTTSADPDEIDVTFSVEPTPTPQAAPRAAAPPAGGRAGAEGPSPARAASARATGASPTVTAGPPPPPGSTKRTGARATGASPVEGASGAPRRASSPSLLSAARGASRATGATPTVDGTEGASPPRASSPSLSSATRPSPTRATGATPTVDVEPSSDAARSSGAARSGAPSPSLLSAARRSSARATGATPTVDAEPSSGAARSRASSPSLLSAARGTSARATGATATVAAAPSSDAARSDAARSSGAARSRASSPSLLAVSPRARRDSDAPKGGARSSAEVVAAAASLLARSEAGTSAAPAASATPAVPMGEFDGLSVGVKRPAPDAAARIEFEASEGRGDETMIEAAHQRPDATEARHHTADAGIAATLRHAPSLPRRRGVWGDLRYVVTVWLGVRRARRELAELDTAQQERERARRRHLTSIGRAAATASELDQTQIRRTRDYLDTVSHERSSHAAQVSASDAEMEAARRERAAKAQAHREAIEAHEQEQAQLLQKLEPLKREAASARRRATDLRNALVKLDGRIRDVETGRRKHDAAAQAAELAALRAERQGVARDEPVIAAQLDSLVPRIASIEATRERLRRKVAELNEEEEEDGKRCEELLIAIAAKRRVVDRATADAEKARERMLAELGEQIYVDRPPDLAAHLAPLDSLDLELGDGQRRAMELQEILASVDRWKLARGIAGWVVIFAVLGAVAWAYAQGLVPWIS